MTMKYTEYDGTTEHVMETEAGTVGGTKRGVLGLSPAIVTIFSAIKTAVEAVATAVAGTLTVGLPSGASTAARQDTGNTSLGSIDTKLSTIDGRVDGLESLIGTTNSTLTTIDGRVDGVEALLTSILAALTPGTPVIEQKTSIGTGADVQFTTAALKFGGNVRNESTSGQLIYLTVVSTPTSTISVVLSPGQSSGFIPAASTSAFFMRASAASGAASFAGG